MYLYACSIAIHYGRGLAVVAAENLENVRAEFERRLSLSYHGDPTCSDFVDADGNPGHIYDSFLDPANIETITLIGQAKPDQNPGLIAFGGSSG